MRLGCLPKWICILDSKLKFPCRHILKNFCGSNHELFTRELVVPQNRACNIQRAKGGQPYQIELWNVSATRTSEDNPSARLAAPPPLLRGSFAVSVQQH